MYSVLDKIRSAGASVADSGFATNNIETEVNNLNDTIGKIEANLATLNFVSTQIKEQTVTAEVGIKSASTIIDELNTDYQFLFGKVKEIINNAE